MGVLRRGLGFLSPVNRVTMAMFAWQNREEIERWATYAARSVPRIASGDHADVIAEGKLRARLTADARTRNARRLQVSVVDGVAHLSGRVDPSTADAVRELAHDQDDIR